MCEICTVEVLQTLSCPVQLLSHFCEGSGMDCTVTYQFQSVDVISSEVLHNVSVRHPLPSSGELPFIHIPLNPNELHYVRMGYCIPEDDFFAKFLGKGSRNEIPHSREILLTLTFLIFRRPSCSATLMVFTVTRCPKYVPVLRSASPLKASIFFETSTSSVIIMDSGNRP